MFERQLREDNLCPRRINRELSAHRFALRSVPLAESIVLLLTTVSRKERVFEQLRGGAAKASLPTTRELSQIS